MSLFAEARQRLEAFSQENSSWAAIAIAGCHAYLGELDAAFDRLEQAYERRDAQLGIFMTEPLLIPLHEDPRWAQLLSKLGLTAQTATR